METLRYSLDIVDLPEPSNRFNMDVPDKMLAWFEKSAWTHMHGIRYSGGAITTTDIGYGTRYSFDIGRVAKLYNSGQKIGTMIGLIKMAQLTSVIPRYDCPDPFVRLGPSISPHDGRYSLAVELPRDVMDLSNKWSAQHAMTVTRRDLLDPYEARDQTLNRAERNVSIDTNAETGLRLRIRALRHPDAIETSDYDHASTEPMWLRGEISSHQNMLVLMAGAVALGRAVELATE